MWNLYYFPDDYYACINVVDGYLTEGLSPPNKSNWWTKIHNLFDNVTLSPSKSKYPTLEEKWLIEHPDIQLIYQDIQLPINSEDYPELFI